MTLALSDGTNRAMSPTFPPEDLNKSVFGNVVFFRIINERVKSESLLSRRYSFSFSPHFGATAPIRALAYLHETFRFTSVY
jgi:hypothetical protein